VRPAGRSRKSPAKGEGIGRKRKEAAQDETTRRINLPSVHLASLQLLGSGLHWENKDPIQFIRNFVLVFFSNFVIYIEE